MENNGAKRKTAVLGVLAVVALIVVTPPLVRVTGAMWALQRYKASPEGQLTERVAMSARASDDFNSARIQVGAMALPQSPAQRRLAEATVQSSLRRFGHDMAGLSVVSGAQKAATLALKARGEDVIRKGCLPRLDLKAGRLVNLKSPEAQFAWFQDCTTAAGAVQRQLDDLKAGAVNEMMARTAKPSPAARL
jgi:hypothetical protein